VPEQSVCAVEERNLIDNNAEMQLQ